MMHHSKIFDSKFLDVFYFHYVFNLTMVPFAASEIGHYLIELRRSSKPTFHSVEEGIKI